MNNKLLRYYNDKELETDFLLSKILLFDIVECIKPEDNKNISNHEKLVEAMISIKNKYGTWTDTHKLPVDKGLKDIDIVDCDWLKNLIQI
tara:strand:+ start:37 stop:306 length:270 start_codon:yes stop_codon:yes gene_type:complete